MTPEVKLQIDEWRQKLAAGELTLDDQRAIIAQIRAGRVSAASASDTARRAKAKTQVRSADQLLSLFGAPQAGGSK